MSPTVDVRGVAVPAIFYGTAWKEHHTEALTRQALGCGFRAIDTANQRRHYLEEAVGAAVAGAVEAGMLRREELFLQTKFTYLAGQDHRLPFDAAADYATQVSQSFESSLEHLGTSYVDAYLLHGPASAYGLGAADWQVWRAMEELERAGKARLIGVSNVTREQLAALHAEAEIEPALVQNRCFARQGWDLEVRRFCQEHGIAYQGFSLLTANGRELGATSVRSIAERHRRTVAQVVFRFAHQIGILPLTGTSSEEHMREDLASFDFLLDDDEVATVERISAR